MDLRALEPGTHLIVVYRSAAELARSAAAFVVSGLEAGDRVVYVVNERPVPAVRAALKAGNAATEAAFDAGQLMVRRFSDVYGDEGSSNLAAAADGLRTTAELARAEGFPGLRIAAEMGNYTRVLGPIEHVLAWERLATRLQQDEGITSVCQYDQRWLTRDHRQLLAAEHAGAAPQWVSPPQARLLATPQGMRITGELDSVNREGCMRVVEARLAIIPRLAIDVGDLAFIDTGTLRRLYAIAAGLPEGGHITLAHASAELHHMIELLGWRHPQLRIDPAADDLEG